MAARRTVKSWPKLIELGDLVLVRHTRHEGAMSSVFYAIHAPIGTRLTVLWHARLSKDGYWRVYGMNIVGGPCEKLAVALEHAIKAAMAMERQRLAAEVKYAKSVVSELRKKLKE